MSCDLWPADSEFELDLYFSVIYLHMQNIQNLSNIYEVIVRKPIQGTDRQGQRLITPLRLRLRGHKKEYISFRKEELHKKFEKQ